MAGVWVRAGAHSRQAARRAIKGNLIRRCFQGIKLRRWTIAGMMQTKKESTAGFLVEMPCLIFFAATQKH
jgi:hypothetical protein